MVKDRSLFKKERAFDLRKAQASQIMQKYPDRVPVIVEKAIKSDIPNINKNKYLVPADTTVGQLTSVVRQRMNISAEKAIFIFVKNVYLPHLP